ncbi:DNA topoisomerase III family protein [Yersinia aldovae]|uniref:DNA topoisomerase n=1 Tax=Yersinia aldovae TaxID=29483 RepID=UPI0005E57927|nr:DNA topoisomerase [Yersinia aldovae]CNK26663.1 DNA topoisomerase III family protein [Yersinia aldovae]
MTKRLFIAEKPVLAEIIAKNINTDSTKNGHYWDCGDDIKVTWLYGHVLVSEEPEIYNESYKNWKEQDLPLQLYPLKMKISEDKKTHVIKVLDLIKQANEIVHAGDPDDEGQLLVDELLIYANNTKPVKRAWLPDLADNALKKSLAALKDNKDYYPLYQRAYLRSASDLIHGFSMTRAYTIAYRKKGNKGVLSVGRVQSPTLGMVVRRFLATQSHVQSYFYGLNGVLGFDSGVVSARLKAPEDSPVDEKGRIISKSWIEDKSKECRGGQATVIECSVKSKKTAPPLPFNLSGLQQQMNENHRISVAQTLEITQALREKYKAITYNRSDCNYLSDEQFNEAADIIAAIQKVSEFSSVELDLSIKSKCFNSKKITAHTAIIPTDNVPSMEVMTEQERTVYRAIVRQYLVQFMPDKCYDEANGVIDVNGNTFVYRAKKETFSGFESFIKPAKGNDDEECIAGAFDVVSQLSAEQVGICNEAIVEQKKTSPPKLFTQATLIGAMNRVADFVEDPNIKALLKEKDKDNTQLHGSIGTEATRSGIIDTLIEKRKYIEEVKGGLQPTELGLAFFHSLPDKETLPDLTAILFEKQMRVENGEMTADEYMSELMDYLKDEITNVNIADIKGADEYQCPECEKPMRKLKGANGEFWACTGYRAEPQCKKTLPDFKGEPDYEGKGKISADAKKAKEAKATTCPVCQRRLKRFPSKKVVGDFYWSCEGLFDKEKPCKTFFPDINGKPQLKPTAKKK